MFALTGYMGAPFSWFLRCFGPSFPPLHGALRPGELCLPHHTGALPRMGTKPWSDKDLPKSSHFLHPLKQTRSPEPPTKFYDGCSARKVDQGQGGPQAHECEHASVCSCPCARSHTLPASLPTPLRNPELLSGLVGPTDPLDNSWRVVGGTENQEKLGKSHSAAGSSMEMSLCPCWNHPERI